MTGRPKDTPRPDALEVTKLGSYASYGRVCHEIDCDNEPTCIVRFQGFHEYRCADHTPVVPVGELQA